MIIPALLLYNLTTPRFASDSLTWIMALLAGAARGDACANLCAAYVVC